MLAAVHGLNGAVSTAPANIALPTAPQSNRKSLPLDLSTAGLLGELPVRFLWQTRGLQEKTELECHTILQRNG